MTILEIVKQPWPWYVAGPLLALVMAALIYFDKTFGFSSNLRTMCSMAGAGRVSSFFRVDWRAQKWNLMFLVGTLIGGFLSHQYFMEDQRIALSDEVRGTLRTELGFSDAGEGYLPAEIFGPQAMQSPSGVMLLLVAGLLVGFGARYAGGCTSGHAITGLSQLQWPSLVAVVGFFIGGLVMVHGIMPLIFG